MEALNDELIDEIVQILKKSSSILFITGAGVSADSGLPTYRGIGGLYNDTVTDEGIPIEMALAGETLNTHPEITWKYLAQIEARCRGAKYNRAHEVIAEMESHFDRVWVLTQNIDGFHHAAGSRKIIDIHGDIHELVCPACGQPKRVEDFSELKSIPPRCGNCDSIVRPDVVFFGELLPYDKVQMLMTELDRGFDIYFSVGTTSVFPYIQQPILDAKRLKRPTVEINPSETAVSKIVDYKLPLGAAEALENIWQAYNSSHRE